MKKFVKFLNKVISVANKAALMLALSVAVAACSVDLDDVGDQMNAYTAFGTIDGVAGTISEDSGDLLYITELGAQLSEDEVKALSGRIFYNYTVLSNRGGSAFDIRLNCIYPLHIEDMKMLSQMTEEEKKALGTDPVSPVQATVSGGYVNVQICYVEGMDTPKDFVHDIDLIFDDAASSDNTMSLLLRHKGDGTNASTDKCEGIYEWVSFRLTEDIQDIYNREDDDSGVIYQLYVVFNWYWWDEAGKVQEFMGSIEPTPYGAVYNESDTTTTLRVPLLQ